MKKYLKNNATIWLNLAMHQHKKGRAVCKKPSCISWVTAHIFHIVPLHQEKHTAETRICWKNVLCGKLCEKCDVEVSKPSLPAQLKRFLYIMELVCLQRCCSCRVSTGRHQLQKNMQSRRNIPRTGTQNSAGGWYPFVKCIILREKTIF